MLLCYNRWLCALRKVLFRHNILSLPVCYHGKTYSTKSRQKPYKTALSYHFVCKDTNFSSDINVNSEKMYNYESYWLYAMSCILVYDELFDNYYWSPHPFIITCRILGFSPVDVLPSCSYYSSSTSLSQSLLWLLRCLLFANMPRLFLCQI